MLNKIKESFKTKGVIDRVTKYVKNKIQPNKRATDDKDLHKVMPVIEVQETVQELAPEFVQDPFQEPVQEFVPEPVPEPVPEFVQEPVQGPSLLDIPFISFQIWTKVSVNLPPDYLLPNPETVQLLFPKTADYYRNLFTTTSINQHVMVDDQVWRRIKDALPKHFKIPDSRLIADLK